MKSPSIMKASIFRTFLFVFFLLPGKLLFPQNDQQVKIDSLVSLLPETKSDTAKVSVMLQIMMQHQYYNCEEGLAYEKPALELAKKNHWKLGLARVHYITGRLHWRLGNFDQALERHFEALRIYEEIQDQRGMSLTLASIGQDYGDGGQFTEALSYFLKALNSNERLGNKEGIASNYTLLAWVHSNLGNFEESAKVNYALLNLAQELDDKQLLALAYSNIAESAFNLGSYAEAKKYTELAINGMIAEDDEVNASLSYTTLGMTNLLLGNYAAAQEAYMNALKIAEKVTDTYCISLAYAGLGEMYQYIEKYSDAIINYNKCIDMLSSISNKTILPGIYVKMGICFLRLKEYNESALCFEKSLAVAHELNSGPAFIDYHHGKAKLDSATGNWEQAYLNYKRYIHLRDSTFNKDKIKRMLSTQIQYEAEAKHAAEIAERDKRETIAKLEQEKKNIRQRTIRNSMVALLSGALVFLVIIYRQRNKIAKEKKISEIEKEKAQSSERAKHQFLANMSHEIRTPMNAIKGMTDILLRRNPAEEQREYLIGIKQSSESLLVIINDILDISKIEAGKIELEQEPFSMTEVVDNVHAIMQFKAEEKGLTLLKDIGDQNLFVKGDATRLRQILINLIGNAIKFTEKGSVSTTLKSEQIGDKINLHFTVSDTGIGIDRDRFEKIFQSFEQAYSDTSRKFGGTGLGLSISKMLVGLHGGRIWVESEKGKGSQFHFVIPFLPAEALELPAQAVETTNAVPEALVNLHVLLVEDNLFNVVVAQEALEYSIQGVTVEVAGNGAIALEMIKSYNFDIILMDVQMPVMNGYEATEAIRKLAGDKANIPIIAMTANVLKEEVDLCYRAGMNDFVGKPFDVHDLIQKIYNLLNQRLRAPDHTHSTLT